MGIRRDSMCPKCGEKEDMVGCDRERYRRFGKVRMSGGEVKQLLWEDALQFVKKANRFE